MSTSHIVNGRLKRGLVIGTKVYVDFTLREADVRMMIEAEQEVGPGTVVAFYGALAARQIGDLKTAEGDVYTGPITPGMIDDLKQTDYLVIRRLQGELERLGESEPEAGQTSTASS